MTLALALRLAWSAFQKRLRRMSTDRRAVRQQLLFEQLAYLGVTFLGTTLLMRWAFAQIDPNKGSKERAAQKKKEIQRRIGKPVVTDSYEDVRARVALLSQEGSCVNFQGKALRQEAREWLCLRQQVLALDVVNPAIIDVSLDDIGGLEDIKSTLYNAVIAPLQQPHLFSTSLLRQAKGVLLFGPPGTGKTMLAKALARQSGACFINLRASTLQSKWFGDTQKLVQATFTLAYKIQPCIIFIDEVDALLGRRRDHEHEAVTSMKTEFMQLWDGFLSDTRANVMVLAATNRPYDLDEAVLRRFTVQCEVPMPEADEREKILRLILDKHNQESVHCVDAVDICLLENMAVERDGRQVGALTLLAERTVGYSGSDLHDLCALAAQQPIHRFMAQHSDGLERAVVVSGSGPLPLGLTDFELALWQHQPSSYHAQQYRAADIARTQAAPDVLSLLAAVLQAQAGAAPSGMGGSSLGGRNGAGHCPSPAGNGGGEARR